MPVQKQQLTFDNGVTLQYALVTPDDFDVTRTYPALLALPPGDQTMQMVDWGLKYWAEEAARRSWLVVSPASPDGRMFFTGAEVYIPALLDHIRWEYHIEDDRFHLGGISNGGRSAFRLAIDAPQTYKSILVLPGFPPTKEDFGKLDRIAALPVAMFVGEQDDKWVQLAQRTEQALRQLGGQVMLVVVPGEGHGIASLTGHDLFDLLDSWR